MGLHIGELIKKKMGEEGKRVSWIARKIGRDKSAIYRIFRQESIHMEMLDQVCLYLEYDFYSDCSKGMRKRIQEKK